MILPNYTLIVGVDDRHLRQLSWTWPTWRRHKPDLLERPMLAFRDWSVSDADVRGVIDHPNLKIVVWPPSGQMVDWGRGTDKWNNPQRVKMLSGFVHVPAAHVTTEYWLKIDTDVVAIGQPDWVDERWFQNQPAIVSHKWGFTRPQQQMLFLDEWSKQNNISFQEPELNLFPKPGADRICHPRIISFVGFFRTDFSVKVCNLCKLHCPAWKMPVPSQDGLHWYCAQRMGESVIRVNMRDRGWQQWSNNDNVRKYSILAIESPG